MISLILISFLNGHVDFVRIQTFNSPNACIQAKNEFKVVKQAKLVSLACVYKI